MRHGGLLIMTMGVLLATAPAAGALTPEQKCQAGKNQAAGKYADCRQKAEATLVKTGDLTKYATAITKCETKFSDKWQTLIDAASDAGATCPDAPLTGPQYQMVIDDHTDNIAQALGGGGLGICGNGVRDGGEQCDAADVDGQTCAGLGYALGGVLGCTAGCTFDRSACVGQAFPETGQTTCANSSGTVVPCAGTGHDGEIRAGAPLAYQDNGDGTVTDLNTKLMWAKKSDDGTIHDKDNVYTWDAAYATYIVALNVGPCFAGYCDWRLPNVKELKSIVSYGIPFPGPMVDIAFDTSCTGGCTVTACSCTAQDRYWSSATHAWAPDEAWVVRFEDGVVGYYLKTDALRVRAVRGSL